MKLGSVSLLAMVVLLALVGLCLVTGARSIGFSGLLHALFQNGGSANDEIVLYLRLPRVFLGVLVGAALGTAGAILQGLARNPLADPAVLGINNGAAFALVVASSLSASGAGSWRQPFSLLGASVAVLVVYALNSAVAGDKLDSLIIVGSVLASFLASITTAILLCTGHDVTSVLYWLVGSLNGCDWATVRLAAPLMAVGLGLSALLPGRLNALRLGAEVAQSIGVDGNRTLALGLVAVIILSGAAVASVGPIGFVGLLVAHFVRALVGPNYRLVLPGSAIMGAGFLLLCDLLARTSLWLSYDEIPVGLLTACLGAPLLVLILQRKAVRTA